MALVLTFHSICPVSNQANSKLLILHKLVHDILVTINQTSWPFSSTIFLILDRMFQNIGFQPRDST